MSDLLTLCASLMARASHVATGDQAMEIALSDGGNVVFLSDPEGGFCAGGITDNAEPELIKTLGGGNGKSGPAPVFNPCGKSAGRHSGSNPPIRKEKAGMSGGREWARPG